MKGWAANLHVRVDVYLRSAHVSFSFQIASARATPHAVLCHVRHALWIPLAADGGDRGRGKLMRFNAFIMMDCGCQLDVRCEMGVRCMSDVNGFEMPYGCEE